MTPGPDDPQLQPHTSDELRGRLQETIREENRLRRLIAEKVTARETATAACYDALRVLMDAWVNDLRGPVNHPAMQQARIAERLFSDNNNNWQPPVG